jgi:hypothetical protein
LDWWTKQLQNGHSQDDADFYLHWDAIREFINPESVIIDIGCGPRPPFAPCIAIDPLADEYRKLDSVKPEWWHGVIAVAMPAETELFQLHGKARTVVCWNCLDHTIGWKSILDNMLSYGSKDARFAIATDFYPPFDGHPGYEREEFEAEIDKRFVITQQREPFDRQLALVMRAK